MEKSQKAGHAWVLSPDAGTCLGPCAQKTQRQEVLGPGDVPTWNAHPFFFHTVLPVTKIPKFPSQTPSACFQRPAQVSCPHPSSFSRADVLLLGCTAPGLMAGRGAAFVGWGVYTCKLGPLRCGTEPGRGWRGEVGHRLRFTDRGQAGSPGTFTFCQGLQVAWEFLVLTRLRLSWIFVKVEA